MDLAAVFARRGYLSRALPGFEPRPQQARMAEEVRGAIDSGRHLLVEAGTGIGKSLAYLVPALLWTAGRTDGEERRVVVSTYQSVSGAGKDGMDELFQQTRAVFVADPIEVKKFTKRIAFNVIPHIDVFMEDGYTKEEWKMVAETKKILDPKIKVTATCVRVPVFVSHGEAVNVEFERPLSADEARAILKSAPGVGVVDHRVDEGYVTQVEAAGEDKVYVSRIREDATIENGLSFWVVADNLRKGAALNAVQIAEKLAGDYLSGKAAA